MEFAQAEFLRLVSPSRRDEEQPLTACQVGSSCDQQPAFQMWQHGIIGATS